MKQARHWLSAIATCLLTLPVSARAQDAQATTWNEVFEHGYPSLEALSRGERVSLDSAPSLGSVYGRCDIGAPDSVLLVGATTFSRGLTSWKPSFHDDAPEGGSRYGRIDAPNRADTMLVQVVRTICDLEGVLESFVVQASNRFIYTGTPGQPWLGLVWVFGRSPQGRAIPLRWAPTTKRLETSEQARTRWRRLHWSPGTITSVLQGNIRIGMTADMVREAWGLPRSVNRTTTAFGQQEQWVYGERTFAYLDNGRLTAVQN